jgi:2-polyprenyl-3-methyl-5-hydroxy-6-metoxy-1,4-benzoquinol methylase
VGYHYDHDFDLSNPHDLYAKVIALVGREKQVLDVGCGSGQVGWVLAEHAGCRVTGLEIDQEACTLARKRLGRVIQGDAERLNLEQFFEPAGFEVILCLDVLEHMIDPWKFLHRIKRWLAPEGHLIATIPNLGHVSVLLELLDGKFAYRDLGLLDRNHLRFFTRGSLEEMFHEAGYTVHHLDRNRVELKYAKIGADLSRFPKEILAFIQGLPEATTYQFIVKAVMRLRD